MDDNGGIVVLLVICLVGAVALGFFIREEVSERVPDLGQTATIQSVISGVITQTSLAAEINSLHASQTALAALKTATPSPSITSTQSPAALTQENGAGGQNQTNPWINTQPGGGTGGKNEEKDWTNLQWASLLVLLFIPCYLAYAFGKQRIHVAEARRIKEKRRMMELEASIKMQMLRYQREDRRRGDQYRDERPPA